jgi:hypothetical protein
VEQREKCEVVKCGCENERDNKRVVRNYKIPYNKTHGR